MSRQERAKLSDNPKGVCNLNLNTSKISAKAIAYQLEKQNEIKLLETNSLKNNIGGFQVRGMHKPAFPSTKKCTVLR